MDSINVAKGYGKVSSLEDPSSATIRHNPPSTSRKRLIAIVIASIIILSAVIAALTAALIQESITETPESEETPILSSNHSESIRTVCSFTEFPDSCFAGISKSNLSVTKFDPEVIYSLSLQAAIDEFQNLTLLPNSLIPKYKTEPKTVSALSDCVELFADGLSQLNNSADSINGGSGGSGIALTEMKIENVKTWTSAAMTDVETCMDGLEEMESTALDEVKMRVQRLKEYMSNSLAILSNIHAILNRFHLKLH